MSTLVEQVEEGSGTFHEWLVTAETVAHLEPACPPPLTAYTAEGYRLLLQGSRASFGRAIWQGLMAMVEKLVSKPVVQVVVTGVHLLLQCSVTLRLKEHMFLSGIANTGKVCLQLIFWLHNLAAQA